MDHTHSIEEATYAQRQTEANDAARSGPPPLPNSERPTTPAPPPNFTEEEWRLGTLSEDSADGEAVFDLVSTLDEEAICLDRYDLVEESGIFRIRLGEDGKVEVTSLLEIGANGH